MYKNLQIVCKLVCKFRLCSPVLFSRHLKNRYLCTTAISVLMKHILICIILTIFGLSAAAVEYDVRSALKELDREVEQRDKYLQVRKLRIDSLRHCLVKGRPDKALYLQLGDAYRSYNNDSLLYFYNVGQEGFPEDSLASLMYLRRLAYMPVAGLASIAAEKFERIDTTKLDKSLLPEYYNCGRQMYSYISILYKDFPDLATYYHKKSTENQGHFIKYLPENDKWRLYNEAEVALYNKQLDTGSEKLNHLLKMVKDDDNLYARAAYMKAYIEKLKGNKDGYLYYLTRSAIADIKSGTLEVAALQELGGLLYEEGEISRPYKYLTIALDNAVKCGAKMRIIESTQSLPLIEQIHDADMYRVRRWLIITIVLLGVALLGLVGMLYYLRLEVHSEKRLRARLETASKVKDVYLARFLDLCSIYVDKMNKLCQVVHRKISAGKTDDLDKLVRSGKFVDEESKEFYQTFDDAFLHIYPTFIDEVNKLLRPDAQIELKENEKLNTDLRILAFMRLGIEESGRIAQVMNYSVNTIYTYRNKMRGRAINRDTFETDVMRIGEIEDKAQR